MVRAGGQQQRLGGARVQTLDPLGRQAAVGERQRQLLAAHADDGGVAGVGSVDGRSRRVVAAAQTAHSESPTSAVNGPVSSKSA